VERKLVSRRSQFNGNVPLACFETRIAMMVKILAMAAVLVASVSGAAMAQYSNPVSGAVNGEAAGAANGYATGGPVGAVIGGAVGTATGTINGTANTVSGVTTGCAVGYYWYNGYCYPNR
jgi:hypothetical protein